MKQHQKFAALIASAIICLIASTGFTMHKSKPGDISFSIHKLLIAGTDSGKTVSSHADSAVVYDKSKHLLRLYKNAVLIRYPYIIKADRIEYKDIACTGIAEGHVIIENVSEHITSAAATALFNLR